ncbi:hypothetical protein [Methylobacterium sp. WSM2598]|uniref:hypothetical protein n=1 Tax=Methylobacterium sp. WSM2598 TaxID=398261 RepID=UPI0012F6FA34|nr:hypothetical protein [Methylobacterium sp. WSM2598]
MWGATYLNRVEISRIQQGDAKVDWLQFLASVVRSLAWPAVVAYLVFLVRHQLGSLARRLTELSLPGGTKALFRSDLEDAKSAVISLAAEPQETNDRRSLLEPSKRRDLSNKDLIREVFTRMEEGMALAISELPILQRRSPADFLFYEFRQKGIAPHLYETYEKIRESYLTSQHASTDQISGNDLSEFEKICEFFLIKFREEFSRWRETENRTSTERS